MVLGGLLFENPYALAALLLLPIIWWLLRFTPPRPSRVAFPPIRLLLGLAAREETPHKSPLWLTALRTLIAALVIVALAEPLFNPDPRVSGSGGPLLVVLDDGWAAAPGWTQRVEALETIAGAAERAGRPVALALTTPHSTPRPLAFSAPEDLRRRINGLQPSALTPARPALAEAIAAQLADPRPAEIIWLSDGLDYGAAEDFVTRLRDHSGGAVTVNVLAEPAARMPLVVAGPADHEQGFAVALRRTSPEAASSGTLRALAMNGRTLADVRFSFEPGALETSAAFQIPLALRNEIGRIEILGARSAGGVFLMDDRWRRRPVGLVSGVSSELAQPLLSPLHYVARALEPFAELAEAPATTESSGIAALLDQGQSVLVLADIGTLSDEDEARVADWVENGGVLVRFAGPRLAANNDSLIPVELRRGGRALGGALSWSRPQTLAPFEEESPFRGLESLATDITVERQVLAEPATDLASKTWARLEDGTPLVTAAPRGDGMVVLFHVPASPDWSTLPMSGLFVQMLRRVVDLSSATAATERGGRPAVGAAPALPALRVLNGYGEFVPPTADVAPLRVTDAEDVAPTPRHPPGLYGRDNRMRAVNAVAADATLAPLGATLAGTAFSPYQAAPAQAFKGPLLTAALLLLLLDALAVLFLSGRLATARAGGVAALAALMVLAAAAGPVAPAQAQTAESSEQAEGTINASLRTHLAYVTTGDPQVDNTSMQGLNGLSDVLARRTALEPGVAIGIDIERDDLAFFPLIYWPVVPDAQKPSARALAKIDSYMKNGGTVLFDTRDQQRALPGLDGSEAGPGTLALREILADLDVPPLEIVPAEHVLTKAFYLLQSFPGRWAGGQLWVESAAGQSGAADATPATGSNYDGVSSIIIGANDYAAAWAADALGKPLYPVVPGGTRQRELAYRTGVNIVMYALTGNYKADQVHVPALLERLGQ